MAQTAPKSCSKLKKKKPWSRRCSKKEGSSVCLFLMGKHRKLAYVNPCTSGKRQLEREPTAVTCAQRHRKDNGNQLSRSDLGKPFKHEHPRAHLRPASLHAAAEAAQKLGVLFSSQPACIKRPLHGRSTCMRNVSWRVPSLGSSSPSSCCQCSSCICFLNPSRNSPGAREGAALCYCFCSSAGRS